MFDKIFGSNVVREIEAVYDRNGNMGVPYVVKKLRKADGSLKVVGIGAELTR